MKTAINQPLGSISEDMPPSDAHGFLTEGFRKQQEEAGCLGIEMSCQRGLEEWEGTMLG